MSYNGFMNTARLDIRNNIINQFAEQLGLPVENNGIQINNAVGTGTAHFIPFANQLEFYHFEIDLKSDFQVWSENPLDSDWVLLNINLSDTKLDKKVNEEEFSFQRFLPSGMLFYTPGTQVSSTSPPNVPFEIALVRFHKSFLDTYSISKIPVFNSFNSAIIYEDLDYQSEELLTKTIEHKSNKLLANAYLLEFLNVFFQKLKRRKEKNHFQKLHPDDLKGMFLASSYLRNPLSTAVPSVEQLSQIAGMGTTKFKTTFKQIFGESPIHYNLKIRLEYAHDQLLAKKASPSEISYQLGYSHPSKFTVAFKKYFGKLPSDL